MRAVPRLLAAEPSILLMLRTLGLPRSEFDMADPGSSCITSVREDACMWSIAWRLMVEAVDSPALFLVAVTTTSSIRKSEGCIRNMNSLTFPGSTVTSVSTVFNPTYCICMPTFPGSTSCMEKKPFSSVMAYCPEAGRNTHA